MASITDCVKEGLKYPFNDIKKILSLGVLFTIINFLTLGILEKNINIVRIFIVDIINVFLMLIRYSK